MCSTALFRIFAMEKLDYLTLSRDELLEKIMKLRA